MFLVYTKLKRETVLKPLKCPSNATNICLRNKWLWEASAGPRKSVMETRRLQKLSKRIRRCLPKGEFFIYIYMVPKNLGGPWLKRTSTIGGSPAYGFPVNPLWSQSLFLATKTHPSKGVRCSHVLTANQGISKRLIQCVTQCCMKRHKSTCTSYISHVFPPSGSTRCHHGSHIGSKHVTVTSSPTQLCWFVPGMPSAERIAFRVGSQVICNNKLLREHPLTQLEERSPRSSETEII